MSSIPAESNTSSSGLQLQITFRQVGVSLKQKIPQHEK